MALRPGDNRGISLPSGFNWPLRLGKRRGIFLPRQGLAPLNSLEYVSLVFGLEQCVKRHWNQSFAPSSVSAMIASRFPIFRA